MIYIKNNNLKEGVYILSRALYLIVEIIAKIHTYLISLNDNFEYKFTDKELHFLIIGLLGMIMICIIHPIFKWLVKHNKTLIISWFYVLTVIIGLTFAIEIGQKISKTGAMEFADIVFGVFGYLIMFIIFIIIKEIVNFIIKITKKIIEKEQMDIDD